MLVEESRQCSAKVLPVESRRSDWPTNFREHLADVEAEAPAKHQQRISLRPEPKHLRQIARNAKGSASNCEENSKCDSGKQSAKACDPSEESATAVVVLFDLTSKSVHLCVREDFDFF